MHVNFIASTVTAGNWEFEILAFVQGHKFCSTAQQKEKSVPGIPVSDFEMNDTDSEAAARERDHMTDLFYNLPVINEGKITQKHNPCVVILHVGSTIYKSTGWLAK